MKLKHVYDDENIPGENKYLLVAHTNIITVAEIPKCNASKI